MNSFTIEYIMVLIGAFLISLILTPLVRFLSFRIGAVDNPNARRINKVPMPSAGGLAILISFLISTLFAMPFVTEKNVFGHVGDITTAESAVKVFVIPTDEELVIARDVERLKTK